MEKLLGFYFPRQKNAIKPLLIFKTTQYKETCLVVEANTGKALGFF